MPENKTLQTLRDQLGVVDKLRSKRDKLNGRKEQLFKTLKEKFKFGSLSQARKELEGFIQERDVLVKKGQDIVARLDEKTSTPAEEFE